MEYLHDLPIFMNEGEDYNFTHTSPLLSYRHE
jgi:hypothetical protein